MATSAEKIAASVLRDFNQVEENVQNLRKSQRTGKPPRRRQHEEPAKQSFKKGKSRNKKAIQAVKKVVRTLKEAEPAGIVPER